VKQFFAHPQDYSMPVFSYISYSIYAIIPSAAFLKPFFRATTDESTTVFPALRTAAVNIGKKSKEESHNEIKQRQNCK